MALSHALTRGWLALLVGLTVVAATLGLWRGLIAQERSETEQAVALNLESVRNEVGSGMDARVMALVRMAQRLGMSDHPSRLEWESDANSYLSHYNGYLAIARVDPDLQVRWLVRHESSRDAHDTDLVGERQRQALQSSRLESRITLTQSAEPATADSIMLVNVPMLREEVFIGYIVGMFHVQSMLDSILPTSIAPRYAVSVLDGAKEIYRRAGDAKESAGSARESAGDWAQEASVDLRGIAWRVRAWPREELLQRRSPLPQAVLAGGLTLALLLAVAVHFAQVAHMRAREVEAINLELGHNIAEHQRANESLRKLSRAVEQSPSIVLITDRHGAIEYVNPKFTQVSGYALEEIADENPRLLKSGETDPEEYERLWKTITSGGEWRGVLHDRKKNGELFWVHSAISPIRDANGTITHFLAEMEDITERKRLEQQVEERNREITKSHALAAMGQAASMIAHDLRNPLSTIKMGLQMLSKKLPENWSEEERELLQMSQEQERYMEEVLSDLLSYSLPDALKQEWLSVDKLLDSAVMISQKQIEEHGVRVTSHYQTGLPVLYGDANKLRQAFVNLIVNGAQATAALSDTHRTLVIDARLCLAGENRPSIQVEICDSGPGIASECLDKVFEPFFTTRAQGTGLGLSIAKRIVDQHQGSITLEPEHPKGTRVTVVLPLQPDDNRSGA